MKWVVATDSRLGVNGDNSARIDTILGTACVTTAASVSVTGRVFTPYGQGLANAQVLISNDNGLIRTATTSSFGYYRLEGVPAGRTYIVQVNSNHFTFDQTVVQVFDSLSELDFTGRE